MSHVVLMGVRGGKDMKKGIIRKGKARKGKKKTDASLVSLKVRRPKGVPIIISSGKILCLITGEGDDVMRIEFSDQYTYYNLPVFRNPN